MKNKLDMNKTYITGRNNIALFTKLLLDIAFVCAIITWLALPVLIHFYGSYSSYFSRYFWAMWALFAGAGAFTILIIAELRKMFATVLADDCFVASNVTSLKRMGIYAFFISGITTARLFLYLSPAAIIIIITFFVAGMFSRVLAQVFEKAVSYKLENDLTI